MKPGTNLICSQIWLATTALQSHLFFQMTALLLGTTFIVLALMESRQ